MDDKNLIKKDKDFAAIQAELDAEREKLLAERRKFEAALKTQQAAEAAAEAAAKAQKAAAKVGRGRVIGGFLRGLVLGLLAGAVAMFFFGKAYIAKNYGTHTIEEIGEDNIIEEHFAGYTAVDFQDAILGEAEGRETLEVMVEPIQLTTTLLREGPWEWEVFRRAKNITYYGTGVYTVDLAKINAGKIRVDEVEKKIYITIPHAKLEHIVPDYEKIEFEDTEMGLFAFTDIKLTAEEQTQIEASVVEDMRTHLSSKELFEAADEFSKMAVWNLFQPVITAMSPEYRIEILFQ